MRTPSRLVVGTAGVLVGAGVATGGAALATGGAPSAAPAAKSAVTTTATTTAATTTAKDGRLDSVLSDLVKSGTITAAQKAKILAAVGDHQGKRAGVRFGEPMKVVADAIGITPTQLRTELKSGKTVAQVAAAHGVSRATLKQKLTTAADARISKLIDKMLDRSLPAKGQAGTNKAPSASSSAS